MANKRKPGKKTAFKSKKRVSNKPSLAVKRYVKQAIHKQIENKGVAQSVAKTMCNISNLANFTSGNILQLTPSVQTNYIYTITQGTGAGNRTGNQVKLRNAVLKFVLYPTSYNVTSNPNPKPLNIMMYIVSGKKSIVSNSVADIATICNSTIYKLGSTSSAMSGNLYDAVSYINTDVLQIHHQEVFKLAPGEYYTPNATQANFNNNDYKYNIVKRLNVTKYLPKVFTFDDANNNATSKQVFAIFAPVYADGTGMASTVFCSAIFASVDITYEDA